MSRARANATVPQPDPRAPLPVVLVVVEIPRGSRNKYEYDAASGRLRLDRTLHSSVHYPTDYGFIPDTLADDGDYLDVLIIVEEPTFPGCVVPVRVIGLLDVLDDGKHDEKVVTVPVGDPRFDDVQELIDLSNHWLREIEAFFATYKLLEDKDTQVRGWRDRAAAWHAIEHCRAAYTQHRQQQHCRSAPPPAAGLSATGQHVGEP
jgi:inorganic pyrophosphatase